MAHFEFTDPDGDRLLALPWPAGGRPGPVVGLIAEHTRTSQRVGVFIPVDRLEEVIAGLRDMARQARGGPAMSPCMCGYPDDTEAVHPTNGDPCYMGTRATEGAGA